MPNRILAVRNFRQQGAKQFARHQFAHKPSEQKPWRAQEKLLKPPIPKEPSNNATR